jgi:hypothetical protein
MPTIFSCPACGVKIRAPSFPGKSVRCPQCNSAAQIPWEQQVISNAAVPISHPPPEEVRRLPAAPPVGDKIFSSICPHCGARLGFARGVGVNQLVRCTHCRKSFQALEDQAEVIEPPQPSPDNFMAGRTCTTLAFILGLMAFAFCPIVFGIAGIGCGIMGVLWDRNKAWPIFGIMIAVMGMVVGAMIGIAVWSSDPNLR